MAKASLIINFTEEEGLTNFVEHLQRLMSMEEVTAYPVNTVDHLLEVEHGNRWILRQKGSNDMPDCFGDTHPLNACI